MIETKYLIELNYSNIYISIFDFLLFYKKNSRETNYCIKNI